MALIKDKTQETSIYHTCDFMILPPHMPKNFRDVLYNTLLTLRKCPADIWCNKSFSDLIKLVFAILYQSFISHQMIALQNL